MVSTSMIPNYRPLLGWVVALWFAVSARGQNVVITISPHPAEIREEFGSAFQRWHQEKFGADASIEWRDVGGASEAQRFVESEFKGKSAGEGIGIDLFFGGGPDPCLSLAKGGMLASPDIDPEVLKGIPLQAAGVELLDPRRLWFGACLASFGILQNQRARELAQLPHIERWDQLAQPEVLGWVGAADARNSGTMNNMYESFLQAYGWERGWQLLTTVAGNTRQFDRFSTTTAKECVAGQTAFAFCVDYFGFTQIDAVGATNLELTLPTDFTSTSIDGIAQLRGGPHPVITSRFITFVLSDAGQRLWYLPKGHPEGPRFHSLNRLPVRPEIYRRYAGESAIRVNPFDLKQTFHFDANLARSRQDIVRSLHGALLVDNHRELVKAWKAIIDRGSTSSDLAELGKVPLTSDEAVQLASGPWKDASERQRLKQQWQRWASEKYHRLAHRP
jgi:ABC-type Fe3+ transport system substrate-binding protein